MNTIEVVTRKLVIGEPEQCHECDAELTIGQRVTALGGGRWWQRLVFCDSPDRCIEDWLHEQMDIEYREGVVSVAVAERLFAQLGTHGAIAS